MIKINVILNNINWKKYLKHPNNYIDRQTSLINKKTVYSKKIFWCAHCFYLHQPKLKN